MVLWLQHPPAPSATSRGMPRFAMTIREAESLVEFLRWTSKIDTNGWPDPIWREWASVMTATR